MAVVLLAGCGDDEPAGRATASSSEEILAPFLGEPPPGYHYQPAAGDESAAAFVRQIKSDFKADAVALRNVFRGSDLAAGIVVLRARAALTADEVASKVFASAPAPAREVAIGRGRAFLVQSRDNPQEAAVIDLEGRLVLIVSGTRAEALRVAAGYVR